MTDRTQILDDLEERYRELTSSMRTVSLDESLVDDLGIDSLTAMELIVWLEERWDVDLLTDKRLSRMQTVGDLVDLVAETADAGVSA